MIQRNYLVPEWDGSVFQAWAKSYSAKNYWRVANSIGDYQDCLSECALIWVECCRRYGAVVDNNAWMMRMFQLCVITTFDTKSMKDSHDKVLISKLDLKEPSCDPEAELLCKLQDASSELKSVMKVFLSAPQEILDALRSEVPSYHPMQFFKAVVNLCGISKTKATVLARELQNLLSK